MKAGLFCLLLLSACSALSPPDESLGEEYALTWMCVSAEDCERVEQVSRIDRLSVANFYELRFTSTQDESIVAEAEWVRSDTLPAQCYWMYFLTLFDHELERSKTCNTPGGVEIEISIPNEDATTYSTWLIKGRDLALQ